MSGGATLLLSGPSGPLVRFLFLTLVSVILVLPPETRGESAAGAAVLVALLAVVCWKDAAPIGPVLAAIAAAGALSTLLSAAPGAALAPLSAILLAVFLGMLARRRAADLREGEAVPLVLALVATAIALYALYQFFWGLKSAANQIAGLGIPDEALVLARLRQGRPFAGFATPAALGGFLALVVPIALGLALESRGLRRLVASAALLTGAGALAASASGTAVAALAGGIGVAFAGRRHMTRRFRALAGTAVLLLVAGVVASRGWRVLDPGDAAGPWRLRAGNIRIAAEMASDHPWTGVGFGAYGESFPKYRRAGDNEARHAHDLPAEMLAETGILNGALLSAAFFVVFLAPAWKSRSERFDWKAGAGAGLAAFALHNLADFTAFCPSLLWTAAFVRGCVSAEAGESRPAPVALPALLALWATTGVACWAFAGNGLGENTYFAARENAAFGQTAAAQWNIDRAVGWAPWDADARLLRAELGLARALAGAPHAARPELGAQLADAERALALAPARPSAYALRARIRVAQNDLPGAYADLSAATRLYPLQSDYARQREVVASRLPQSQREGNGR